MAYDVSDFEKEVFERSYTIPVLVDFWADWCGPCKVLGPVLERLAGQSDGRWMLAKVNTEKHVEVARKYNIQSIPNVKLFIDGVVVNEFVGALPEYQVQRWLETAIPSKHRREIEQAEAFLVAGNPGPARVLRELTLSIPCCTFRCGDFRAWPNFPPQRGGCYGDHRTRGFAPVRLRHV